MTAYSSGFVTQVPLEAEVLTSYASELLFSATGELVTDEDGDATTTIIVNTLRSL